MIDWKKRYVPPWLQHGAFWGLSTYVLFRIFNQDPEYILTDLIYTVLFQISLWVVVYLQLWVLIPRFFKSGRYLIYLLGFGFSLWLGAAINWLTFEYLADWLFPNYYFISYYKTLELLQFMLVFAVTATLLKLSKSWFDLRRQEKQINRLEREKLDAELQALKGQLDPHFLFNSLNNLYSLSLDEDKKLPEYLLRLSDNLRYMLYECSSPMVPLTKEIEYLQNYLKLQQLRTGPQAQITLGIVGATDQFQVAPLLFIPFVENSFKHGLRGKNKDPQIRIQFDLKPDQLNFHIQNSLPEIKHEKENLLPKTGGIGLENAKKRLQLLYPDRHHLTLEEKDHSFHARLQLIMNSKGLPS